MALERSEHGWPLSQAGFRSTAGFTLIEMLVAMAIFSAMVVVLLAGFDQGMQLWERSQRYTAEWRSAEQRFSWLTRMFGQSVATDFETPGVGIVPYFNGDAKHVIFLTSAPLLDTPGTVKRVRLSFVEEAGQYSLVYWEEGIGAMQAGNVSADALRVTLIKDLQRGVFRYQAPANPPPDGAPLSSLSETLRKRYRYAPEWLNEHRVAELATLPQQLEMVFVDSAGVQHTWYFITRPFPLAWSLEYYFG